MCQASIKRAGLKPRKGSKASDYRLNPECGSIS